MKAGIQLRYTLPSLKKIYNQRQWRVWRFVGDAHFRKKTMRDETAYGEWMKKELINLGPAFIKLGQFLSTRSDIFSKETASELVKLQDDIPEVPLDEIVVVIEEELGRPWQDIFATIEPKSLASASIGQVHIATLKENSLCVVIKVQKPKVNELIENDLRTLGDVVRLLGFFSPQRGGELESILNQYQSFLSNELDYKKESECMDLMKREIEGFRGVYIPKTFPSLSTQRLLVMEYVPSVKITEVDTLREAGIDTTRVATNLAQTFLYMIIYIGVVHCDPHPGNLGILKDGETIVLYDFGNVVPLGEEFKKYIFQLVFAVAQKDVDEFIDLLLRLRIIEIKDDIDLLELKSFCTFFFEYLDSLDFNQLRQSIVQNETISQAKMALKVDQNFLSLFRVFSLLDGTCLKLDPTFSYIQALQPFADEVVRDPSFVGDRMLKDVTKLGNYPRLLKKTDANLMRLDKRVKNISTDVRIAFGLLSVLGVIQNIDDPGQIGISVLGVIIAYGLIRSR